MQIAGGGLWNAEISGADQVQNGTTTGGGNFMCWMKLAHCSRFRNSIYETARWRGNNGHKRRPNISVS